MDGRHEGGHDENWRKFYIHPLTTFPGIPISNRREMRLKGGRRISQNRPIHTTGELRPDDCVCSPLLTELLYVLCGAANGTLLFVESID
jgi:hypothetical protein